MKFPLSIATIIAVLAALIPGGCTRNDGNIGDWFGTWKLESITIDGEPDAALPDDILWKFQSSVFSMVQVYDKHHSTDTRWASWRADGDTLLLEFIHSDNETPSIPSDTDPAVQVGTGKYSPLPATHIPSGITRLTVVNLSRSSITLRYTAPTGAILVYHLVKWG